MTTARRNHLTTDTIRSPFISERRRKLFPTDDHDTDSDLGHISPIHSDDEAAGKIVDLSHIDRPQDNFHGSDTPMSNRTCSDAMSPLKLSPCTGKFLNETPRKWPPTQNYKTPHDTSTRPVLEKEQKTLLEEVKSMKRKCSPGSSPESSKCLKSDMKNSKVRTALFPPESTLDMSLSTKSFYSKNQEIVHEKLKSHREKCSYKPIKFSTTKHSYRKLKKFGQINNGVRHKIRKPKQRKISKAIIATATKKMMETGSVLNEYIQDLTELRHKQNLERKLIQQPETKSGYIIENPERNGSLNESQTRYILSKKSISSPPKQTGRFPEENKENVNIDSSSRSESPLSSSPVDKMSRKFFKSSRAKIETCKEQKKPLTVENEPKNFVLPTVESHLPEKIVLDSTNDFQEDDTEPEANIENILSVLSSESTNGGDIDFNKQALPYIANNSRDVNLVLPNGTPGHLEENNYCGSLSGHDTNENSYSAQSMLPNNFKSNRQIDVSQMSSKMVLGACNSITASENSIQLHQPIMSNSIESTNLVASSEDTVQQRQVVDTLEASNAIANVANTILSPISQMCDVTSGLALNSPRKGRDLTRLLSNMSSRASKILSFNNDCHSVDMEEQKKKLFPIFYKGQTGQLQDNADRGEKRPRADTVKRSAKKFKGLPPDQMLLDAGQKKFGLTLCNECNIVYHMGDPNDEIQHMHYHNAHHVLRFAGWRNERIVADFHAKGRIIKVLPTDSKIWIKKVKELMEVVLKDLGCYEMEYNISQSQVYLYIRNRTIAGCVTATVPKEEGHKMLSTLSGVAICSEESYPIKCGISHIWVADNYRKQGVASALLDVVKCNFILGEILANNDIALTSPTEAGSAFAEKYFKTPNYLIYYT